MLGPGLMVLGHMWEADGLFFLGLIIWILDD